MRLGGGRRAGLERSCTWRARAEFDRELEMQPAKMVPQRQRRNLCRDHSGHQMNECTARAIIVGDRLMTGSVGRRTRLVGRRLHVRGRSRHAKVSRARISVKVPERERELRDQRKQR